MEKLKLGSLEIAYEKAEDLPALFEKMRKLMASIGAMKKDGKNTYFGYKFVSYEAMAATIRASLVNVGLAFFVCIDDVTVENGKETTVVVRGREEKSVPRNHRLVTGALYFADVNTGAIVRVPWAGESFDSSDKGLAKAATFLEKYGLLRNILGTEEGEVDPDMDADLVHHSRPVVKKKGEDERFTYMLGAIEPVAKRLKLDAEKLLYAITGKKTFEELLQLFPTIAKEKKSLNAFIESMVMAAEVLYACHQARSEGLTVPKLVEVLKNENMLSRYDEKYGRANILFINRQAGIEDIVDVWVSAGEELGGL